MLTIRLSRTGKTGQPSFRLVVAEHSLPVKGKYLELLGNYIPATDPKKVTLNEERIKYWLSKGAKPSDSAASLLKKHGFADMDKFMEPRDKKHAKKKGGEEAAAPAAAGEAAPKAEAEAPKTEEPAKEEKPVAEEAPAA